MEVTAYPTSSTNNVARGCITDSSISSSISICPRCGREKGLPVTHNEKPDAEQLLRIQSGELLWIRLSALNNPYRLAANWKCIWCEFEWRDRRTSS